jgi:hypothetical protein
MKRLIQRQQVIDCGEDTCGRCKMRKHDTCLFFGAGLLPVIRCVTLIVGWIRCYQCKNAEVRKP